MNPAGMHSPITFGRMMRPEMQVTSFQYLSEDPQGVFVCSQVLYEHLVTEKDCAVYLKNVVS